MFASTHNIGADAGSVADYIFRPGGGDQEHRRPTAGHERQAGAVRVLRHARDWWWHLGITPQSWLPSIPERRFGFTVSMASIKSALPDLAVEQGHRSIICNAMTDGPRWQAGSAISSPIRMEAA